MFISNALVTPKFRKLILMGLAILGVMVALPLTRKTDASEEEIPCTTLEGFGKPVQALAFSLDGKTLATGDGWLIRAGEVKLTRIGGVKLWDVNAGTERVSIGEFPNAIKSLEYSPDGKILAIGCYDGTARLWDLLLGQYSRAFPSSEGVQYMVAFSPDSRTLATWGSIDYVQLRDLNTGDEQTVHGIIGPVAFCRDDHPLKIARFHNATICNAPRLLGLAVDRLMPWSFVFSPDGHNVAVTGFDGAVIVWNAYSGEERITIPGHHGQVNAVAFSPDGKIIASGNFDGTVQLWAVATGEELACFRGHTRSVTALAFASDGQKIASASYDQTARIWHLGDVRKKIGR